MRAIDIIMKKRGTFSKNPNGAKTIAGSTILSKEEIQFLISGYVRGEIPEYQISAFLMAVYFNGMTSEEIGHLTNCMLHSGSVIDLSSLQGPFVDKHSTGGVGDKISLPLAPIVASCGCMVPMMSGRALGHTGGTLDKLESIEGYNVMLQEELFKKLLQKTGYAMIGQTKEIVPADRLLYALRDVTGTVESVPLITASILSKKVAEGSTSLVFDVKYGTGAFMKSTEDAEELALSLVNTAKAMGKNACALLTNMNTPLGRKIGNFLEIEETLECLQGNGPDDIMEETYALGSLMLLLSGKALSKEDGVKKCKEAVTSGKALEKFLQNVEDQGGSPNELLKQQGNRRSKFHKQFLAEKDGYIFIDALEVGLAGVELGVGRNKTTDPVCADAGFILNATSGTFVKKGELIMDVFGKDENCFTNAFARLKNAIKYSDEPIQKDKLIYKEII
ncbi:MAG: thymidine phosphorylase [Treponema sp.]|nr:thymidine phosphorylase [Treponema sp.]